MADTAPASTAKLLAGFSLAAQAFVIGLGLFIQPSASFDAWLWHLDREWNILATLASAQLALVAFVTLMIAWLGHADSGEWWVYDQQPPGRYRVFTGLYWMKDLERVPASGADGALFRDARVSIGDLVIE